MLSLTLALIFLATIGAHANNAILNADGVLEIDGKKIFVICFSLPPPVDGKANEELKALVAKHFACPKSDISIKSGGSGRVKLIQLEI